MPQSSYQEADLVLAISSIGKKQIKSASRAASIPVTLIHNYLTRESITKPLKNLYSHNGSATVLLSNDVAALLVVRPITTQGFRSDP